MDNKIPKIKKKITAFLVGEEGKISKKSLLTLGVMLSGAVIGSIMNSKVVSASHRTSHTWDKDCEIENVRNVGAHKNSLSLTYSDPKAEGMHKHCLETHSSSDGY